jgi:hypothetical protein
MEVVLTLCENFVAHVRRFSRRRVQILLRTSVDFLADVCRKNQIINLATPDKDHGSRPALMSGYRTDRVGRSLFRYHL